jgi:hypothetical protein
MLTMYNIEKSALNQKAPSMSGDVSHEQGVNQGTVLDDLMQGRVTQEVMTLRWRLYKVLEASSNLTTTHTINDKGKKVFKTEVNDRSKSLKKVKLDPFDNDPLEMVIDNRPKAKETHESFDGDMVSISDKSGNVIEGSEGTNVLGEISAEGHSILTQPNFKIKIERDFPVNFSLEKYTKKLNIRTIDETTKLMEFYVNKYPDEYDRKTNLFIANVLKIEQNSRQSPIIDFNTVSFTTFNDIGIGDNRLFKYEKVSYHSTIEFDGHYVVKLVVKVITNGDSIVEKYRMKELDEKYANNEKRQGQEGKTYVFKF